MSRPGDTGWTLSRMDTDEAGVKRVRYVPLPGDPRPVIDAAREVRRQIMVEIYRGEDVPPAVARSCDLIGKALGDYDGVERARGGGGAP